MTAPTRKPRGLDPWSVLAAVFAVPAAAAATWFVIGDLTTTDVATADYLYRQPAWLTAHESVIGVVSIVLLAVAVLVLLVRWRQRQTATEWRILAILWIAAGIWIGFLERALTVGVVGANIGGGVLLIFVAPIALLTLVGLSAWLVVSVRRAPSPSKPVNPNGAG